jgi:hypothetical protein
MFTQAVAPLLNSTSLQLELLAEAMEINHQKTQMIPRIDKSFFMGV